MTRAALLLALCAAAIACGSKPPAAPMTHYLVVTVVARPAVHDATSISVTLANAGTMRTDSLMLNGKTFPVTFSISAPGRTGDLAITVDAKDDSGLVIGHGSAMGMVTDSEAMVMLDSTDFVVNTDYAGDQFPTDDFLSVGFQLAALPDGTWTTVFRDGCTQGACNMFARRFDHAGKPVATQAAAGTNAFVVTARPSTDIFTEPAVASSQTATIALWGFTDPAPSTATGVACRTISADGTLGGDQTSIASDSVFASVSGAALATGNFIASWSAFPASPATDLVIRSALVKPDCTTLVAAQPVSTAAGSADRNALAASADHALFTWVVSDDLHARMASGTGALTTADAPLIKQTTTDVVSFARIAGVSRGGFALAVLWAAKGSSTAPGKIELYQVNAAGALVSSTPVLVTDQAGSESFGIASRPDDTVMIAWHVCNPAGDMCTLSGRIMKVDTSTGATAPVAPVTDVFAIPTTTGGSQKRPSVVGLPDAFAVVWSDSSGQLPDSSGQAVRARIIYPPGS